MPSKERRPLDVPLSNLRPSFDSIKHYLTEGEPFRYAFEKQKIIEQWKSERYRVCSDCLVKKLRSYFVGASKYCIPCMMRKTKQTPIKRRLSAKRFSEQTGYKYVKMVVYALKKMGILVRKNCEVCGDPQSFAHHTDYNIPWQVIWLCKSHHQEWHRNNHPKKLTSWQK